MRNVLCAATVVVALCTAAATQAAQKLDYPARPVRLIVPFATGGSVDISSRILAGPLTEILGQQIVVDNRAGASGSIGANMVAKAAPDGYTLLAGSSGSVTANRAIYSRLPYDSLRDFAPISMINVTPMVVVTYPGLPVTSIRDLIELARSQPGKITVGSAGIGSSNHLALELFQSMAGVKLLHVPYKGTGAVYTDLIGGQVQAMFDQIASSIGHVQGGKLRALGVTSLHRSTVLPNIPTLDESGIKGYEAASFTGVLAPAGTPQPVLDRLHAAVVKAARMPAVTERFKELAADPKTTTPQEFAQFMRSDIAKWQKVAQIANIKLD
jgi:tripartite-type tricarboxylate transporter receptor subunit TctC